MQLVLASSPVVNGKVCQQPDDCGFIALGCIQFAPTITLAVILSLKYSRVQKKI